MEKPTGVPNAGGCFWTNQRGLTDREIVGFACKSGFLGFAQEGTACVWEQEARSVGMCGWVPPARLL